MFLVSNNAMYRFLRDQGMQAKHKLTLPLASEVAIKLFGNQSMDDGYNIRYIDLPKDNVPFCVDFIRHCLTWCPGFDLVAHVCLSEDREIQELLWQAEAVALRYVMPSRLFNNPSMPMHIISKVMAKLPDRKQHADSIECAVAIEDLNRKRWILESIFQNPELDPDLSDLCYSLRMQCLPSSSVSILGGGMSGNRSKKQPEVKVFTA